MADNFLGMFSAEDFGNVEEGGGYGGAGVRAR